MMFEFANYPLANTLYNELQQQYIKDLTAHVYASTSDEWRFSNLVQNLLARKVLTAYDSTDTDTRYFQENSAHLHSFQSRVTNGMNLSDRVWNLAKQSKQELEMSLSVAVKDGRSANEVAKEIKQYLKEPNKLFRRVRDEYGQLQLSKNAAAYHPGRGVYRSSFRNARRLVATEANMAYRTAEQLRWSQMDFIVGYEVKTSQSSHDVEDVCDCLAGKYPKDFTWSGWHPLCRCYEIPLMKTESEFISDSKDSKNEVTEVPDNFKQWVEDNEERIAAARERGTEPYFLKDNAQRVDEILQSTNNA
jgi:hypothetical protein